MANNDNVVIIGTALKWRGVYDSKKKYYNDNIVTAYGCVFRCKILQTQNFSPVEFDSDTGHLIYINQDVWDVIVDNAYYYNFALDSKEFTEQILDFVKELDEDIQTIQEDDKRQWDKINKIKKHLKKTYKRLCNLETLHHTDSQAFQSQISELQQSQLTQDIIISRLAAFLQQASGNPNPSLVDNGIWDMILLWDNEDYWNNNYSIISNSSCGCKEHNEEVDKKITALEGEVEDLKNLLKNILSGKVTVDEYDGETQHLKLKGALYYVDYHQSSQKVDLTAPLSNITHDEDESTLSFE